MTHQGKICNVLQCVMNRTCLCQRNNGGFRSFTVQPYLSIFILHNYWHSLAICKILTVLKTWTRITVKHGTHIPKINCMKNVISYTVHVYNHYKVLLFWRVCYITLQCLMKRKLTRSELQSVEFPVMTHSTLHHHRHTLSFFSKKHHTTPASYHKMLLL